MSDINSRKRNYGVVVEEHEHQVLLEDSILGHLYFAVDGGLPTPKISG